jgi:hypothetical protein
MKNSEKCLKRNWASWSALIHNGRSVLQLLDSMSNSAAIALLVPAAPSAALGVLTAAHTRATGRRQRWRQAADWAGWQRRACVRGDPSTDSARWRAQHFCYCNAGAQSMGGTGEGARNPLWAGGQGEGLVCVCAQRLGRRMNMGPWAGVRAIRGRRRAGPRRVAAAACATAPKTCMRLPGQRSAQGPGKSIGRRETLYRPGRRQTF